MANKTREYLTSDWKIWTYKPFDSRFILDFSQLDDASTPLSASDGSLEVIDTLIGSIEIAEGSSITQGIFSDFVPASMSASLIVENFTATDARRFLVGSLIAVSYRNAETVDNYFWGKNTPVFYGRVRSFSVDVQPGSDYATISVEATSTNEDQLNTLVTVTKDTSTAKSSLINTAAQTAKLLPVSGVGSAYNFASTNTETKSYGEWLTDLNTCDLYVASDDITLGLYYYSSPVFSIDYNYQLKTAANTVATSSYTFDSTNIIDMELDWSGAGSPTGVTLTNYFNSAIVYQYGNSPENQTGGGFAYEGIVDVKDLTQMTTIGQKMLSMWKTFTPVSITTKTATNFQNITFKQVTLANGANPAILTDVWVNPVNLPSVTQTVQVDMPDYGYTNQKMLVTGRTIVVTPDDWTTTYNLWKGFTA